MFEHFGDVEVQDFFLLAEGFLGEGVREEAPLAGVRCAICGQDVWVVMCSSDGYDSLRRFLLLRKKREEPRPTIPSTVDPPHKETRNPLCTPVGVCNKKIGSFPISTDLWP